jgi:hypothetical protein
MFTDVLFDGESQLFERCFAGDAVSVYGEYGCGASTLWVLHNTRASVVTVDTSPVWAANVQNEAAALEMEGAARLTVDVVDVGELGDWGTPLSYRHADQFPRYTESIFSHGQSPDLILVDGRFRVACFLTAVLRSAPGTKIVFDDYYRQHYHIVEEVVPYLERDDRQAVFVVPEGIDVDRAVFLRERFLWVMN